MSNSVQDTFKKLNRFFFLWGICMLASELWKQWYLTNRINDGIYQWWYLPFQLCSIPMYILLVFPWLRTTRIYFTMLSFLMCYSLLGGIAVFVDTSGLQYPALPLTVHSYLWHIILIIIGICAGIVSIRYSVRSGSSPLHRSFWDSTILYLGCCIVASLINRIAGKYGLINMFYINPRYKMQQIGFSALVDSFGNTTAIISYIVGTILGAKLIFYVWCRVFKYLQQSKEPKKDLNG